MTMCPNSKAACECQPQDGVMCPHGPTPPYPVAVVRADVYGGATVLWDVKPNELPPGTRLLAQLPDGVPAGVRAAPPSVASSNTERVVFKCDNPGGCRFPKQPCLASCSLTVNLAPTRGVMAAETQQGGSDGR